MYSHLALSENGFLFDTKTGQTYNLNRTGAFILRNLVSGTTASQLSKSLSETFEVDEDTAIQDVEQFIFRMRDLGLRSGEDLDR